ncbi:MAG TPA: RtcB family protein, partial [Calditrichaeota bacterium]|nr:RtcB family protein [Calditrichota bacterium]
MKFRGHRIEQVHEHLFEIPQSGSMLKPGRIYANTQMMQQLIEEGEPLQQVINVAHLPGIEKYSLAMPDIHWGYGFPIGGVAATDWDTGFISPGGVGYDINCGVRLASTSIQNTDVKPRLNKLIEELFRTIPTGVGSSNAIQKLNKSEMNRLLREGAHWVIEQGFGCAEDLPFIEETGRLEWAQPELASARAIERGQTQLGTLGSGNHFLEIDEVDHVYDKQVAEVFGLFKGQIVVLIHTGSRGLGYQVCDDYLKVMGKAAQKYHIALPDRQLASAPISSQEGQDYISAMAAAANFAWGNRQV